METDIERIITTKIKLKAPVRKHLKLASYRGLTGYYNYGTETIGINLSSIDFQDKSEEEIIRMFEFTDTHELLHHEIYKITGKYANETEERFIDILTGEVECQS